jgi:hypothetical protein
MPAPHAHVILTGYGASCRATAHLPRTLRHCTFAISGNNGSAVRWLMSRAIHNCGKNGNIPCPVSLSPDLSFCLRVLRDLGGSRRIPGKNGNTLSILTAMGQKAPGLEAGEEGRSHRGDVRLPDSRAA